MPWAGRSNTSTMGTGGACGSVELQAALADGDPAGIGLDEVAIDGQNGHVAQPGQCRGGGVTKAERLDQHQRPHSLSGLASAARKANSAPCACATTTAGPVRASSAW